MSRKSLNYSGLVAAAIGLLVGLAMGGPASARGGGHAFGSHFHGGGSRGGMMMEPAYAVIIVSSVTDADAFKKDLQDLATAVAPFSGRLAADADKPVSWEGPASEHVVIIQFADAGQAQNWKNSDPFKTFDAELHRSSGFTLQMVQGLPVAMGRGGHGGRFDARAYEPNVKDYDRLLDSHLKTICKGC